MVLFVAVDSLLIVTPIVGSVIVIRFVVCYFMIHSSFAIILVGKRELVPLLSLSSWCPVIVV